MKEAGAWLPMTSLDSQDNLKAPTERDCAQKRFNRGSPKGKKKVRIELHIRTVGSWRMEGPVGKPHQ